MKQEYQNAILRAEGIRSLGYPCLKERIPSGLQRVDADDKDIEMVKRKLPKVALSGFVLALAMSLVVVALPVAKPVEAAGC